MSKIAENIFDELKGKISGELYADKLHRYMLSTDGSIFRREPACVVYPKSVDDVRAVCKFASDRKISVHSRGAGSGLCGAALGCGIVLDFSKYMNKLLSYSKPADDEVIFSCEPGYKYGELEKVLQGSGLFWPPVPSSGEYATFGGMYGTNAGGAYSVKYGNVSDYILDAEIVLADGSITTISEIEKTNPSDLKEPFKSIYSLIEENKNVSAHAYPPVACNVSGYNVRGATDNGVLNLRKLLGGSEGTLAVTTRLTFKLMRKKLYSSLVVAYFDDKISSAKATQLILKHDPDAIEIMEKSLLELARDEEPALADKIPTGIDNVLLIEFAGDDRDEAIKTAETTLHEISEQKLASSIYVAVNEEEKMQFQAVRKSAVPILYRLKGKKKILALVEDAAVPTERLTEYFEGLYKIFGKYDVKFVTYGHIAKGLLHNRPLLDLKDPYDIKLLKTLADEVFELVQSLHGTISGEHGDGRLRSPYISRQYREIYSVFTGIKALMDPENILNPEIKTSNDPAQMTKHLRYGSDYGALDHGNKMLVWNEDFIREVEKCHGCSKCTTITTATRMCPVYKYKREESASPKAKANVLRALLSGAVEQDAIYSEAFISVINKCINCGSCAMECPSKVNIPKLAMEARARYVKKFGTPIDAKLVTNFELAGRTIRKLSGAISFVMKPKVVRKISSLFTGLAPDREFVHFASKSLYERLERTEGAGEKTVLFFAGCYASYIKPEIGECAVKILKKLGFKVIIPEQHCCGIPHVSKGMASQAKSQIMKNIRSWGKLVQDVDYIVSACSSCALSLTKEWGYVVNDPIISDIAEKTRYISDIASEFLKPEDFKDCADNIAYHIPCHLRLLKNPQSSINLLKMLKNAKISELPNNCCGIAGSWGVSTKNYSLSVDMAYEMRKGIAASGSPVVATDCPTCAMQIEHLCDKKVVHPVEVIAECLNI